MFFIHGDFWKWLHSSILPTTCCMATGKQCIEKTGPNIVHYEYISKFLS